MGKLIRQITVICQQDQAFAFEIQTSDNEQPVGILDNRKHTSSRVGAVAIGKYESRFIQHDINLFGFRILNNRPVYTNRIFRGICFGTQFRRISVY